VSLGLSHHLLALGIWHIGVRFFQGRVVSKRTHLSLVLGWTNRFFIPCILLRLPLIILIVWRHIDIIALQHLSLFIRILLYLRSLQPSQRLVLGEVVFVLVIFVILFCTHSEVVSWLCLVKLEIRLPSCQIFIVLHINMKKYKAYMYHSIDPIEFNLHILAVPFPPFFFI